MNRFTCGMLGWALALVCVGGAHAELIIDAKPLAPEAKHVAPVPPASTRSGLPRVTQPIQTARPLDRPAAKTSDPSPAAPPVPTVVLANPAAAARAPVFSRPGTLKVVGAPPVAALASLDGWAKDVPLDLAVRSILPQGWALNQEALKGSAVVRTVSWSGGKPWPEVLRGLAHHAGFDAELNWDSRTAVLTPVPPPAPIVVAPPAPTWDLDAQHTLRENIEAWAKKAGWNRVVWEGADYPIVAPARFVGELDSPSGPLAKIIEAYEDSDQPLTVELSTWDKVIHVTNRNFRSVVVEAQTAQSVDPASFRSDARTKEAKEADALAPHR